MVITSIFIVGDIDEDILYRTAQDGAKVIKRNGTDGLIVFESMDETTAYVVGGNQLVSGYFSIFERLIKGLVGYHFSTSNSIIVYLILNP